MRKTTIFFVFYILYCSLFIGHCSFVIGPAYAAQPVDLFAIGKRQFKDPPTLLIAQPQAHSTIFGDSLTVRAIVDNLVLTNFERVKRNQKGQGHLHLWLDTTPLTVETAIHHFSVEDYVFTSVSEGKHTLVVEVVNNDHSSFDPPVMQIVEFETITGPTGGPTKPPTVSSSPLLHPQWQPILLLLAVVLLIGGFLLWRL